MPVKEAEALFKRLDTLSRPDWRAYVEQTYGLALRADDQVTALKRWYAVENLNAKVESKEKAGRASGKSLEEVRREAVEMVYEWAQQNGDGRLALATVRGDLSLDENDRKEREYALKVEALGLAERKVKIAEEKAVAARAAKEKLTQLAEKGGLAPETLQQIEEAAGLL